MAAPGEAPIVEGVPPPAAAEGAPAPAAAPVPEAAPAPAPIGPDAVLHHLQGMGQAKSAEISVTEKQIKEMKKEAKRVKYHLKFKKERAARLEDKATKNLNAAHLLHLSAVVAAEVKAKADAKTNTKAKGTKAYANADAEAECGPRAASYVHGSHTQRLMQFGVSQGASCMRGSHGILDSPYPRVCWSSAT